VDQSRRPVLLFVEDLRPLLTEVHAGQDKLREVAGVHVVDHLGDIGLAARRRLDAL
jgi:hypothetical protein